MPYKNFIGYFETVSHVQNTNTTNQEIKACTIEKSFLTKRQDLF